MEWTQRFCLNQACHATIWMVTQPTIDSALWWVCYESGEHLHTIAAVQPICPWCRSDLLTTLDIEGGFGTISTPEEGPVFDFLRSLD